MKIETISGAAIAAIILFITGFMAVFQQDGVTSWRDISEAAWWILAGGAALSFFKDYQALSTRRLLSKMAGVIDNTIKSPPLAGILALLLACAMLSGCGIQRPPIDSISDGIVVTAADVETAAQAVKNLCRNTAPGGPCAPDAAISTRTKERLKESLQAILQVLRSADMALAVNDTAKAEDRLARTQALLGIVRAELARLQN